MLHVGSRRLRMIIDVSCDPSFEVSSYQGDTVSHELCSNKESKTRVLDELLREMRGEDLAHGQNDLQIKTWSPRKNARNAIQRWFQEGGDAPKAPSRTMDRNISVEQFNYSNDQTVKRYAYTDTFSFAPTNHLAMQIDRAGGARTAT